MILKKICQDPFRLFFPIAISCMLYASFLWIAHVFFSYGEFPIERHASMFFGGFLYFSILGFLLTAVPRFTQTEFLSVSELFVATCVVVFNLLFYFLNQPMLYWGTIAGGFFYFMIFGATRFLQRKQNPPFTFIFVGAGIVLGFLGSFSLYLYHMEPFIFEFFQKWGKLFFFDAMVTSLIIGVGGRLIPGILGFIDIVKIQRDVYEVPKPFLQVIPKDMILSLVGFVASLVIEGVGLYLPAYILRAIIITYFAFKYWRLHEKIPSEKWHGRVLKISCWFLLITSWLLCFTQDYAIHIKHLIYIGTYLLMTLMVSSRVILAHGSGGLELETKKMPFLVIGLLFAFAALTRASAFLIPDSYMNHLAYTGVVLIAAIFVWGGYFAKKFLS